MQNSSPTRKKLTIQKKTLFAIVVCGSFFLGAEVFLGLLGVKPIASKVDPLVGFSVSNPLFVPDPNHKDLLVTAPGKRALFNAQQFQRSKPKQHQRVFCLGGSTTYGRPYQHTTSFAGWLQEFLAIADEEQAWEVINAGGISYGSFRVAALTQELTQYDPDLLIVYTGHNEFLERKTYAELLATPEPMRNMIGLLSHTRTFTALKQVLTPSPRNKAGQPHQEVDAILDQSIGPAAYHRDQSWETAVIDQFRASLNRIIRTAKQNEIPIILVTPASNLSDFAPFKSEFSTSTDAETSLAILADVERAKQALAEEDWSHALKVIEEALAKDTRYAELHYLRGKALQRLNRSAAAREALQQALVEDICPLRAKPEIIQIIHDIAKSNDVPIVDFEDYVMRNSKDNIPGNQEFLDHVHPTIRYHRELAQLLVQTMQAQNLLKTNPTWKEKIPEIVATVEGSLDAEQMAIAERNLAKVLGWAGKQVESDRLIIKASRQLPDDAETQSLAGDAFARNEQWEAAAQAYQNALALDEHNVRSLEGMGNVANHVGQLDQAKDYLRKALNLAPDSVLANYNLGNAHFDGGEFEPALNYYQRTIDIAPDYVEAHKNLGLAYAALGQSQQAIDSLTTAMELAPHDIELRIDLGFILIDAGQTSRAETIFQQAAKIEPDSPRAKIGIAVCHLQNGNINQATQIAQDLLQQDPENGQAKMLMQQINGEQ